MICLVEDNDAIRESVRAYLELSGYEILEFSGVAGVIEALAFKKPELFILDIMLGDGNGFVLAKRIRQIEPEAAFVFLTAKESESDRITGFELGAEDYIVKPFSPRELVLRVKAILRRLKGSGLGQEAGQSADDKSASWRLGNDELLIKTAAHEVLLNGKPILLTPVEWRILCFLTNNAGLLVSRDRILGECLDYCHDGSDRTVITHLKNLRAKLGDGAWIETLRGFGYKFKGQSQDVRA